MDVERSQEADNGFLVSGGPWFTGGSSTPFGLDGPIGSVYRQSNGDRWIKIDSGTDAWIRFSMQLTSTTSVAVAYLTNGEIDTVTFYNSATQIAANQMAFIQMNYDVSFNPTTEVWTIFTENDGTTVLKTITYTYTFTGDDLTNVEVVVT